MRALVIAGLLVAGVVLGACDSTPSGGKPGTVDGGADDEHDSGPSPDGGNEADAGGMGGTHGDADAGARADAGGGGGRDAGGGGGADAGGDEGADAGADSGAPSDTTLRIDVPPLDVAGGDESRSCYYFRTTNTEMLAVHRFEAWLGAGVHSLQLYTTVNGSGDPADKHAPGTLSSDSDCGISGGTVTELWAFSADTVGSELDMPADDGSGDPLAFELPPNTAGFLWIHYLNVDTDAVSASPALVIEALDSGTSYTPTAPFSTVTLDIDVPAASTGFPVSTSCSPPPDAKLWWLSTHSRKRSVSTKVSDLGPPSTTLFESTNWEHPGATERDAAPFLELTGDVRWECTYDNPSSQPTRFGGALSDETCMMTSYFFPATRSRVCVGSLLVP